MKKLENNWSNGRRGAKERQRKNRALTPIPEMRKKEGRAQ